jgi:hypothetical protein
VFGVGFALLGYCPGTVAGGAGQGALDAVFGGISGMLIGSALFATFYSSLNARILKKGKFANITLPHLLGVNEWVVVVPAVLLSIAALGLLEYCGVLIVLRFIFVLLHLLNRIKGDLFSFLSAFSKTLLTFVM